MKRDGHISSRVLPPLWLSLFLSCSGTDPEGEALDASRATGGADSGSMRSGGETHSGGSSGTTGGTDSGGSSGATGGMQAGGNGGTGGQPCATDAGEDCEPDPTPEACPVVTDPDAEVFQQDGSWRARNGEDDVYDGSDFRQAVLSALSSLTPGRATKQSVVVRGSGTMNADQSIDVPSYTVLDVCGTIHVTGSATGDNAVLRMRNGVTNVDIPHLSVTGSPSYGIFIRRSDHLHLGRIELRLSGGHGIRVDNDPPNNGWGRTNRITDIRIDDVYVEGTSNHGVETYGVDGLTIGRVVARNTAYSGLLLNATVNADVGLVDGDGAGTGSGYATFRMANENGRLANFGNFDDANVEVDFAPNIHVGEVRARGGGRGIFCVSGSGGAVIDRVDIVGVGTRPAIFIEDCYNITLAQQGGTVDRGSASHDHDISITARAPGGDLASFLGYSDRITVENLTIIRSPVREGNCGAGGVNIVRNNVLVDSSLNVCSGTNGGND